MNRIGGTVVTLRIAATCCLALSGLSGTALAEDGWTAPHNELLLACYQGIMNPCDRIASDRGMVFDTPICSYAATCGGRLDLGTARRPSARMLENGVRGETCSYIFKPE
jgi:hypothetical protein